MDLLQKTQKICKENNIQPARSKGQNFLIDENVYDRIVEAAEIDNDDTILEVGPGLGFLTEKLAEKAGEVVAVELDDKLAGLLREKFGQSGNVAVVNEDILNVECRIANCESFINIRHSKFDIRNYKIVANLPYNITSIFIRKFLESENKPKTMTLMLQKEVAERICAKPGEMSLLAVSVQFYAEPKILFNVPRQAFWPVPAVDSAVLGMSSVECRVSNEIDRKDFFRLVKIGFSARRKMLKNNLASGYHISQDQALEWIRNAGFDEKVRAQELGVSDWQALYEKYL